MYIGIGTIMVIVLIVALACSTEEQIEEVLSELWQTVLALVVIGLFLLAIAAVAYGILHYARFI